MTYSRSRRRPTHCFHGILTVCCLFCGLGVRS